MHDVRIAYLVFGKKKVEVIQESRFLPPAGGGCPITGRRAPGGAVTCSPLRFGRMFDARAGFPPNLEDGPTAAEWRQTALSLIALGECMDDPAMYLTGQPASAAQDESDIPAGYTYLGQFITHEITFDGAERLPPVEPEPKNVRSPSLDLDSLYGAGPRDERSKRLFEEVEEGKHAARLKVGWTQPPPPTFPGNPSPLPVSFPYDLPRVEEGEKKGEAIIGDERNDENLPLAQTHVALIHFHNRVVNDIEGGSYKQGFQRPPARKLFDKAKAEVVKHFQWIILKDYLPRLVDEEIIESLIRKPSSRFNPQSKNRLFIPLEFSVAAFRIGHSMVRQSYEWNRKVKNVALDQLFIHTKRSGNLRGLDRLDSQWIIDWKRFYDFTPFAGEYPPPYDPPQVFNKAGKIDTTFDLHLGRIGGFQHLPEHGANNGAGEKPDEKASFDLLFNKQKALPVRNLLRGLALGLPWGEDVAGVLKKERLLTEAECLTPEELRVEPHAKLLEAFGGKTPLWFYVLREARVKRGGAKLGRVGGRIVAETLIGLIRHSRYSILRRVEGKRSEWEYSDWLPAYPRKPTEPETFEMVDLLRAAGVVDPLGLRAFQAEQQNPLT